MKDKWKPVGGKAYTGKTERGKQGCTVNVFVAC